MGGGGGQVEFFPYKKGCGRTSFRHAEVVAQNVLR